MQDNYPDAWSNFDCSLTNDRTGSQSKHYSQKLTKLVTTKIAVRSQLDRCFSMFWPYLRHRIKKLRSWHNIFFIFFINRQFQSTIVFFYSIDVYSKIIVTACLKSAHACAGSRIAPAARVDGDDDGRSTRQPYEGLALVVVGADDRADPFSLCRERAPPPPPTFAEFTTTVRTQQGNALHYTTYIYTYTLYSIQHGSASSCRSSRSRGAAFSVLCSPFRPQSNAPRCSLAVGGKRNLSSAHLRLIYYFLDSFI